MDTITKIKVENMNSLHWNCNSQIANQFIITTPEGRYFQSYESVIAYISNNGEVWIDANKWDFSSTTSKYRNVFLGEDTKATRKKIKDGVYHLTDLN